MKANRTIGECTPDSLIYDTKHSLDAKAVELNSGSNVVKRGTVIASDNNDFVVWDGTGSQVADGIITDNVDTGDTPGTKVMVTVYRSGHFNKNALIFGGTATELTNKAEKELRDAGIFLSTAMD